MNHDILLIMLTGISKAPSKIVARNSGVKRILAKPVAGYTLKNTMADELNQSNKRQAPNITPNAGPIVPLNEPLDCRILGADYHNSTTNVLHTTLGKNRKA